jgi:hypothetical protein
LGKGGQPSPVFAKLACAAAAAWSLKPSLQACGHQDGFNIRERSLTLRCFDHPECFLSSELLQGPKRARGRFLRWQQANRSKPSMQQREKARAAKQ